MTGNNQSPKYLNNEDLTPEPFVVEVPSDSKNPHPERLPVPFTPMGEINNRGKAASSYARGEVSWWILITGVLVFGLPALFMILLALDAILNQAYWLALLPLAIALIFLLIIWRGISSKLRNKRRKRNQ